jgi:hypothetical protein
MHADENGSAPLSRRPIFLGDFGWYRVNIWPFSKKKIEKNQVGGVSFLFENDGAAERSFKSMVLEIPRAQSCWIVQINA